MFKLLNKRRYPTGGLWGMEIVTEDIMEKVFETSCWSYIIDLNRCLNVFGINTPRRVHHFLSQLGALTNGMQDYKTLYCYEIMRISGIKEFTYFAQKVQNKRILLGDCTRARIYRGRDYVETAYPLSEAGCWWQLAGMNEIADEAVNDSSAITSAMIAKLDHRAQRYIGNNMSVYSGLVEKYYTNAQTYIQ